MHDASPSMKELRLNGVKMVHIAKRDLALSDESYRAVLERVAGERSAGLMNAEQLGRVLEEFRRLGWKPSSKSAPHGAGRARADSPQARKARALWLTLYHLGEVTDPSEKALAAYAARVTGSDALQFLGAEELNVVIEGLKDWATRAGFSFAGDPLVAQRDLLWLQWCKLADLGAVHLREEGALASWLQRQVTKRLESHRTLSWEHVRAAREKLGAWIRRRKAEDARAEAPSE